MFLFKFETYSENVRLIGAIALLIAVLAWVSDMTGFVYECPYCRTQRTVIGLLGVLLMLPNSTHWIVRYIGSVLAFLGAHVAAAQHFRGWAKISGGTFEFNERIYIDSFLLSGCALFIIIGLLSLLWFQKTEALDGDAEVAKQA